MPQIQSEIGNSYLERKENTPNDALTRLMNDPEIPAQGVSPASPNEAKFEEVPFEGKYPNLYGMYGAAKEIGKSMLPWVKYIDPEEREKFSQLSVQQQTRDLLLEDLNFALLGRWKPIEQAVKTIGGAALETFLPKTYAALVKPRTISGVVKSVMPEVKPDVLPAVTPAEVPTLKQALTSEEIIKPPSPLPEVGAKEATPKAVGGVGKYTKISEAIRAAEATGNKDKYFIRFDTKDYAIGDTLPKSRKWAEDGPTEKILSGTSAIDPRYPFKKQFGVSGADLTSYEGNVYLVKGKISRRGHDEGEVILKDPVVLEKLPAPSPLPEAGVKGGGAVPPPDIPVIESDDVFSQIKKLADNWDAIIDTQRRGARPHELARAEGELLGMTPADARAISPGTAMNDSQAAALIGTVNKVATKVQAAAVKAIETGSPADMKTFLKKFLALGEVDPARWGVRTEAGRSLSIMNEPISGINQYLDQFSNALKASETMTPERLAKMVSELKDAGALAKLSVKAAKAGPVDMIMETWINGLLSGPVTHSANISGNILTMILQPAVRLGAAISGKTLPGEAAIPMGESAHMLYGMVMGIKDAFRMAGKSFMTGKPEHGAATKLDWRKAITGENMGFSEGSDIARAVDLLGETVRLPGRALMAEDEFFKSVATRMEIHARAYREGIANGFEREDLASFIAEETRNPSGEIKNAAQEFAKYVTYQKDLGEAGKAFQNFVSSHPSLKVIFPFVRTPINIFKFAGEMTPLAPFSSAIRSDIAAGGAKRDLALSKIALGTSMMTAVASYVAEGKITGGGPSNPVMRAALMRTGWQPYSIKIGDKYYQYGRLEPLATILGVAASGVEIAGEIENDDIDYEKIPSAIMMAISKNVVNKTFLQGIANLVSAIEDPDRYGSRYIQNLAGSTVPAMSAQITRSIDKDMKSVNSIIDTVKSRVPGWSKDLPLRLDLWGEPLELDTWGPMILSPVRKTTAKESQADQEIWRNKVPISMPSKHINGVELTPQEYNRFVELAGRDAKATNGLGAKEAIETMISSSNYDRQSDGPDGGKALMLKTQIYLYRELAKKMLLEEYPDLKDKMRAKLQDKQAAMMPNF